MWTFIQEQAQAQGFAQAYFTQPAKLALWRQRADDAGVAGTLTHDVPREYPWASCVILLVRAYRPFAPDERIPGYYVAQNAGYHAAEALSRDLTASTGKRFELTSTLPARATALGSGIGTAGKNGLLRIDPYGSRIALYTLLTDACGPEALQVPAIPCPEGCLLCADACPAGAIAKEASASGTFLTQKKCLRFHMNKTPYEDWVYPLLKKHMGCDVCMDACPLNRPLGVAEPDAPLRAAFALERLLAGNTGQARQYVGRNATGNGKLLHEAYFFKHGVPFPPAPEDSRAE